MWCSANNHIFQIYHITYASFTRRRYGMHSRSSFIFYPHWLQSTPQTLYFFVFSLHLMHGASISVHFVVGFMFTYFQTIAVVRCLRLKNLMCIYYCYCYVSLLLTFNFCVCAIMRSPLPSSISKMESYRIDRWRWNSSSSKQYTYTERFRQQLLKQLDWLRS